MLGSRVRIPYAPPKKENRGTACPWSLSLTKCFGFEKLCAREACSRQICVFACKMTAFRRQTNLRHDCLQAWLGSESRTLHQIRTQNRIQEIVSILRFLLPFRGIFALSRHKKHIFDKRSPSSERFYTFGGWAFLLALKLWVIVKIMGNR